MSRILLTVAFDGTAYEGWQSQPSGNSVQDVLENRLSRLYNAPIRVHSAGRTDAGVHALGMTAHYTPTGSIPPEGILRALSCLLPADIRVHAAVEMPDTFHARFDAVGKTYQYLLTPRACLPWMARYQLSVPKLVHFEAMATALSYVEGTHHFSGLSCRGSTPVRSDVRTIFHTQFHTDDSGLCVRLTGDGFLYRMVRSIVGVLVDVGTGHYAPEVMRDFLETPARTQRVKTVPPQGLFLEKVYYDRDEMLLNTQVLMAVKSEFRTL